MTTRDGSRERQGTGVCSSNRSITSPTSGLERCEVEEAAIDRLLDLVDQRPGKEENRGVRLAHLDPIDVEGIRLRP